MAPYMNMVSNVRGCKKRGQMNLPSQYEASWMPLAAPSSWQCRRVPTSDSQTLLSSLAVSLKHKGWSWVTPNAEVWLEAGCLERCDNYFNLDNFTATFELLRVLRFGSVVTQDKRHKITLALRLVVWSFMDSGGNSLRQMGAENALASNR